MSVGSVFAAQFLFLVFYVHTAFVAGGPWSNLKEAVRTFLSKRVSDSANDLISIIEFGSKARILCEQNSILDCLGRLDALLDSKGGGTNFSAALRLAHDVLRRWKSKSLPGCKATDAGNSPVLLFMSDGKPDSREMTGLSEMQVLPAAPVSKRLSLSFGTDSKFSSPPSTALLRCILVVSL
jgi:hypothetical protein